MLVVWGLVLALAVDVIGRRHVLPDGQVVEIEDEFEAVRCSTDPTVRRKKRMLKNPSKLWEGAAVFYEMGWMRSDEYLIVWEAMEDIMRETCVRFKERSGERDYVFIGYSFEGGSSAHVGRVGGKQEIRISYDPFEKGVVLHEMGHTLSLEHEFQRPDRDHYIEVIHENINGWDKRIFRKIDRNSMNILGEPFDFDSIMMYHDTQASEDPNYLKVMRSKWGHNLTKKTAKCLNTKLSAGDIRRIRDLYRCDGDGTEQKPKFPFDVVCPFDFDDCNFKGLRETFNLKANWVWEKKDLNRWSSSKKQHLYRGGYLFWSLKADNKTSTEEHAWSVGFYSLSPLDKLRGPRGCVNFKYSFHTQAKGRLTLKLMQVELRSPIKTDDSNRKSSSEIWSATARWCRTIGRRKQEQWEKVESSVDIVRPFLLDFAASLEDGIGEYSVKIKDLAIRYTPCENLSHGDAKKDGGRNTGLLGRVKRSLSPKSGRFSKFSKTTSSPKSSLRSLSASKRTQRPNSPSNSP